MSAETFANTEISFPKELRAGLFRSRDKDFFIVFLACSAILFSSVYVLSLQPVTVEVSEKQIAKIQERYANLVLNQKKPEPPPQKEALKRKREETEGSAEQAKMEVNRTRESMAERGERKMQTQQERAKKREVMVKEIASSGIFAAITASSGSGHSSQNVIQDLIGSGDVSDQISSLEISGKSFSQASVDVDARRQRRETRSSGGSISQSKLESVKGDEIARRGNVEFTEKPQEVQGEATQNSQRTPMALSNVIKPEQARLVYVYEKWLKKDPNLTGKLVIRFTILANGSVSSVDIVSSTTNNPEFDSTICRYIKRWEFSPISENSGSVTVVYPFVFTGVRS